MSLKVKVITVVNHTERGITDKLEEWIASESPTEIVSMTQSSCNDPTEYIVTVTILYRKQTQQ